MSLIVSVLLLITYYKLKSPQLHRFILVKGSDEFLQRQAFWDLYLLWMSVSHVNHSKSPLLRNYFNFWYRACSCYPSRTIRLPSPSSIWRIRGSEISLDEIVLWGSFPVDKEQDDEISIRKLTFKFNYYIVSGIEVPMNASIMKGVYNE